MEKKECIKCGKEFTLLNIEITPDGLPYIHHDILCPECKKQIESQPQPTECIECGGVLDIPKVGICGRCRDKKVEEAKAKGLCVSCYVKPQSMLPTVGGTPSNMCKECLMQWSRMTDIWKLNNDLFEKTMSLKHKKIKK